jgi:heat-inducible transcriptional repressor
MSLDLRKESILEAIVREYTDTGVPVGSLTLAEKYSFPLSPATIRAEMSELEREGYLSHPHTSAGRIPTEKGYRYFVDLLEKERGLLGKGKYVARKRISSHADSFERQLSTASEVLAEITRSMGFAGYLGEIHSHGLSSLFSYPELSDSAKILKTAELIDNLSKLVRELPQDFGTKVYIGSEIPVGKAAGCSVIVSEFESPLGSYGYLGIVGPTRMSYEKSLSAVSEVKNILEEESAKEEKKQNKSEKKRKRTA